MPKREGYVRDVLEIFSDGEKLVKAQKFKEISHQHEGSSCWNSENHTKPEAELQEKYLAIFFYILVTKMRIL
jgi:hypothetical protein